MARSPTYFRLTDMKGILGRWYLGHPRDAAGADVDPRLFLEAQSVAVREPVRVGIRHDGTPLDFTLADFDMPVLRKDLAVAIAMLAPMDIQLISAFVDGSSTEYAILNALTKLHCLDEAASTVTYWTESDEEPERLGQYKMVIEPKVHIACVGSSKVFRIDGWEIALIVSDEIKRVLDQASGAMLLPA